MQNNDIEGAQNLARFIQGPSTRDKIARAGEVCHFLLDGGQLQVPEMPGRDVEICLPSELPAKKGFSQKEAQARLLHDLASIELQAYELALRTLSEFPEAPRAFRERLVEIALDEARHLNSCLDSMESLGFTWGNWAVHCGLWQATSSENDLLERILIVHRYLEGSGLDAGDTLLRKLQNNSTQKQVDQTLRMIVSEEIGHVDFGSQWYRKLCREFGVDEQDLFKKQMALIYKVIPRREKINRQVRKKAGFSDFEIDVLEAERAKLIGK